MDSSRWYYEVETTVKAYTFMRNLALETIQLLQELKNEHTDQSEIFERDENEMREILTTIETDFRNDIIRIQDNLRRAI